MALPIRKGPPKPSDIRDVANGQIPKRLMTVIQGDLLHHIAARAMLAMLAAMTRDLGFTPSFVDLYRPYTRQYDIFIQRYRQVSYVKYLATSPSRRKKWVRSNGTSYWLHVDGATAAVPGTSNHGWGLAADFENANTLDDDVVRWLLVHADEYGFWMELASELWHWTFFGGDTLPPAVLAYEAKPSTPDPTLPPNTGGPSIMEDDMVLGFVKLAGRDEVYAWTSGMQKIWLPDLDALNAAKAQQGALAYFANRPFNANEAVYPTPAEFRALGPIDGPRPEGLDNWGCPL